jgi:KaiC/GvpD/RAD55 family RecA-like ATPase
MRSTHHPLDLYPFEITDQGIKIEGRSLEDMIENMEDPSQARRQKPEQGEKT